MQNVASLWERPAGTLAAVDGLRALAVLWVIEFHALVFIGRNVRHSRLEPVFRVVNHGLLGVDVFFVISGFLIARLLFRELASTGTIAFRRFYVRRALRILPAYYVCLLLYCVLDTRNADTVWANLVFSNNFLPERRQCMPWAWSLAIEEQFYVVFPLLLVVLFRATKHRLAAFLALLALGIAIRLVLVSHDAIHLPSPDQAQKFYDALYDKPYARFGELLAGAITAYVFDRTATAEALRQRPRLAVSGAVISAATVVALALVPQPIFRLGWPPAGNLAFYALSTTAFSIAVAFLLFVCLSGARGGRHLAKLLGARVLRPIAQLSYAAYLLHVMIITFGLDVEAFASATTIAGMAAALIYVPVVSLLAAAPLYLLVEKPLMNLRAR